MSRHAIFILALLFAALLLTSCQSDAAREQQMNAEAKRQVAVEDEERSVSYAHEGVLRGVELAKQNELDAVEQKRTGNVYAHSCRKAVALDPALPVSIDTKACSTDQLRVEQEAERRQLFDEAFRSVKEKQNN